ncbi:hypothetical protein CsatB_022747 [Cannabis sativa]|uniref:uncharacterized protein LOC115713484 n=1 Tax=Cannabis sativa TaxID=3483 RepID=UPI0011DF138E|nr:uncharacterized protein LOC115713484 [Cannabis sativa]
MMLSEFEINFVPQRAIKGQALADFLVAHPIPDDMELREDLPDKEVFTVDTSSWQLYFDGAARSSGAGAGIVFVTPSGGLIRYSFHILSICTNNVAEYEALVIGLEVALEMKVQSLEVFGDSLLVIKQMSGEFGVKHENLVPYHEKAKYLLGQFQDITLNRIPRSKNGKADALANLAASLTLPEERDIQITIGERHVLSQSTERVEEENTINLITFLDSANENDWRQPIKDYIQKRVLLEDLKKRVDVRRRAPQFVVFNDTLYKRSFDGILLRCLSVEEATHALQETHADAINFAKCCKSCQLHGDFIHQPPQPLRPSIVSWPFETWGMDVIGPFTPPSSKAHKYILAITDYFSKWAEAVPLKEVRAEDVADFIRTHVIYRYGVPSKIISDTALYFKCKAMVKLMNKYKFKHSFSASYNPS